MKLRGKEGQGQRHRGREEEGEWEEGKQNVFLKLISILYTVQRE